jgi:hypothetical protein
MRVNASSSGIFHAGQRLDDLEDIAARAEVAARARDHHDARTSLAR